MKTLAVSKLPVSTLRDAASTVDVRAGNSDAVISTSEITQAIDSAASGVAFDRLWELKTFVEHYGNDGAPAHLASGDVLSTTPAPIHLGEGQRIDSCTRYFPMAGGRKDILEGQSILVPLDEGQLHMVEVRYQDTRKLRDIEFNYQEATGSAWKTFRGDQWFEMLRREQAGDIKIQREPDHNAPWMNNPVRVKLDILYPDGRVHDMGKKLVDFHVHDARSVDGPGSGETDNIYKRLPHEKLPAGCLLRMTPYIENKKDWESTRDVAVTFEWARPIRVPPHSDRVKVHSEWEFTAPPREGYEVDSARKVAAVLVTWTDNGGFARGSLSFNGRSSAQYNVGSGETELIPVDDVVSNGRISVQGSGSHPILVKSFEVLYA